MPFTPFHMGPGAALKALLGPCFSLIVFGFTQIAVDLEPLIRLLRNDPILHGHSHTYLGAGIIAVLCFVLGWPLCRYCVDIWNRLNEAQNQRWLQIPTPIGATSAALGAFLGAGSHVLLDSLMHTDMRPWWPWSNQNTLLYYLSTGALHYFCVISGVVGILVIYLRHYWRSSH